MNKTRMKAPLHGWGGRIKKARAYGKVTQQELADALSVQWLATGEESRDPLMNDDKKEMLRQLLDEAFGPNPPLDLSDVWRIARQNEGPHPKTTHGPLPGDLDSIVDKEGKVPSVERTGTPVEAGREGASGRPEPTPQAVLKELQLTIMGEARITLDLLIQGPSDRVVHSLLDLVRPYRSDEGTSDFCDC